MDQKTLQIYITIYSSIKNIKILIHIILRTNINKYYPQLNCHKDLRYSNQFLLILPEGLNRCLWKNSSEENNQTRIQFPNCRNIKDWKNLWLLRWLRPSLNLLRSFNLAENRLAMINHFLIKSKIKKIQCCEFWHWACSTQLLQKERTSIYTNQFCSNM